jgi:hypothetical protein
MYLLPVHVPDERSFFFPPCRRRLKNLQACRQLILLLTARLTLPLSAAASRGDISAVNGGDFSAASGGDISAASGGDISAVSGGDFSAVNGCDISAFRGGDFSVASGGDISAVSGGDFSAVNGCDFSETTMVALVQPELFGRHRVFSGDIGWAFLATGLVVALVMRGRWRVFPRGIAPPLFDVLSLLLSAPSSANKI